MGPRSLRLRRTIAALIAAANVLASISVEAEETVGSNTITATPQVRQVELRDGDDDGIMDDSEKELVNEGLSRPGDASEIGRYSVTEDQDLYSGGGTAARLLGKVKKGEFFTVILPGEHYSRIRLKDGRLGWVDKTKIVRDGVNTSIDERGKFGTRTQKPSKPRLEAGCDTCKTEVPMPNPVDRRKAEELGKIAGHLKDKYGRPPRTPVPTPAEEIVGVATGRMQRLIKAAHHQAMVCRVPARYLWRRKGHASICGNNSKGKCYRAVKEALVEAGVTKHLLPGEAAKDAHYRGYLAKAGMKNIMPQMRKDYGGNLIKLATSAPAGAVLVYDGGGHGYGHIEIKTAKDEYCSDFCRGIPVNYRNARRLIGIYMP